MDYRASIIEIIKIDGVGRDEVTETLVFAKDTALADYALPCFKWAKTLRLSPQVIATNVVENIAKPEFLESIEAVNGYVNFKLSKEQYVRGVVAEAESCGENYGASQEGVGKTICIDYSSINIAKPFHMGHLSTTVIGAALYKIYKTLGYNVVGINHLGDWGTQFGKLITAYKLWGSEKDINERGVKSLLEIYVKFHKEADLDSKLNDEARRWFKRIEDGDQEAMRLFLWFKEVTLKEVDRIYNRLHVHFDSYNGESFFNDKMQPILDEIEAKGLSEMSEGAMVVKFDDEDMAPCLLRKADGATLYATRDLAAAFYRKKEYNFYKSLYVVAYQQNLHFKQFFKVIEKMGYDWASDLVHVPFGMVSIQDGKLSTREGNVVFVEDVLDKARDRAKEIIEEKNADLENKEWVAETVGVGAVIFGVLTNNKIKDVVFSYEKVLNFDGETGPYVQYTYARSCSLIAKCPISSEESDYSTLALPEAFELAKLLDKYPTAIREAGEKYEPSILTRHILLIAAQFNKFYLEQNISNAEVGVRNARMKLVNITNTVIRNGMKMLGIECPTKM